MRTIEASGCAVSYDSAAGGYWRVTTWRRLSGHPSRMEEEVYRRLTWTELTDVVLAHLSDAVPGSQVSDELTQPVLWADTDPA